MRMSSDSARFPYPIGSGTGCRNDETGRVATVLDPRIREDDDTGRVAVAGDFCAQSGRAQSAGKMDLGAGWWGKARYCSVALVVLRCMYERSDANTRGY